ncbi:MAG: dihydropteroate synthase [Prochlorococcus sp.]
MTLKALLELPITRFSELRWPQGWRERTTVMGVINITPDSFSDGGKYLDPRNALDQASLQLSQGADVLDLGAQSTRPGAEEVGWQEELNRLIPALISIRAAHPQALISVDTFLAQVAKAALEAGADWINDVSGGWRDPELLQVVAEAQCPYVLTHSRGNSQSMDQLTSYDDVSEEVRQGLLRRTDNALKAGIQPDQLIWDPGLGFAKTTKQNLILLRDLNQLCSEGFPILVGPSRKRFIGDVLNEPNPEARIWGTAVVASRCVEAKVAMVRVHDVGPIAQTIKMAEAVWPKDNSQAECIAKVLS